MGKNKGGTNGFDKRPEDARKAGQTTKRGKSPKTVVQEWLTNNPDDIEKIISAYAKRAAKGDVSAQEFMLAQGKWLAEQPDMEVTIKNPVFVVNQPKADDGMDDK